MQKDTGFGRGISDTSTTPGADLPELEDLEEEPHMGTLASRERERAVKK